VKYNSIIKIAENSTVYPLFGSIYNKYTLKYSQYSFDGLFFKVELKGYNIYERG
jgi:hypothetical protein